MTTKSTTHRIIAAAFLGGAALATTAARADGDITAGRDLFASRCAACHGLDPTRKPGPLLSGVYGRHAGSVVGYHYSDALRGASIVWNEFTLDRWLRGPPAFVPGVNMQAQVDSARDRRNIIAYLKSLSITTATRGNNAGAPASALK
jgi:cytochrome c